MAGVGRFLLIDPEDLDASNVVRHAAGLEFLGQPKVNAVKALILDRNEAAEVETIKGDATKHLESLRDVDFVVVGLDGEPLKQRINIALRRLGKAATYGVIYERGIGGDICVVYPDHGPCYACIASILREVTTPTFDTSEELDYGQIGDDGTLHGEPGLGIHVQRLATIEADWVIRELLREAPESSLEPYGRNTLIFANERLELETASDGSVVWLPPLSSCWLDIERSPGCLVCSLEGQESTLTLDQLLDEREV